MDWINQNYKWLFDGIGALILFAFLPWVFKKLRAILSARSEPDGLHVEEDMGEIRFEYLPSSPLDHKWKLADPQSRLLEASVPLDRANGLKIRAQGAIDIDVEKYQQVCNRVKFVAKMDNDSYVYTKIQLVSKDGHTVSRSGWIACEIGAKPVRRVSRDEWVIYRQPQRDGWTVFDLSLPSEVKGTFGRAEGLEFSELLGIRLRGSLNVSPIQLYLDPLSDISQRESSFRPSTRSRTRPAKWWAAIAVIGIVVASLTVVFVPQVRVYLGLDMATAIIGGTVVDGKTNLGLAGAEISVSGRPETCRSEANGHFRMELRLNSDSSNPIRLEVTKAGYNSLELTVFAPSPNVILPLMRSAR